MDLGEDEDPENEESGDADEQERVEARPRRPLALVFAAHHVREVVCHDGRPLAHCRSGASSSSSVAVLGQDLVGGRARRRMGTETRKLCGTSTTFMKYLGYNANRL